MQPYLLYSDMCSWEYDYIVNDLLFGIQPKIEIFDQYNFKSFLNREDDIISNNILVINIVFNIDDIINVVKYIKPIVIFYLSDELGNHSYITELEKYTNAVFRQYNHTSYNYSTNNYQLPLGYSKYFLNNQISFKMTHKKIHERDINCSFIGNMKSDRQIMTNVFKQHMNNTNIIFVENTWNIDHLPYSPVKCFEIYNNSIFVICGRGNCNLDCFRIYEAIVAGAIPVVVGSMDEIKSTFFYNGDLPPMIYDETWDNAVVKCNELLNDPIKLQNIQDNLIEWWNNKVKFINSLIVSQIS